MYTWEPSCPVLYLETFLSCPPIFGNLYVRPLHPCIWEPSSPVHLYLGTRIPLLPSYMWEPSRLKGSFTEVEFAGIKIEVPALSLAVHWEPWAAVSGTRDLSSFTSPLLTATLFVIGLFCLPKEWTELCQSVVVLILKTFTVGYNRISGPVGKPNPC